MAESVTVTFEVDLDFLRRWATSLEDAAESGKLLPMLVEGMKEKADHLRRAIAALEKQNTGTETTQ